MQRFDQRVTKQKREEELQQHGEKRAAESQPEELRATVETDAGEPSQKRVAEVTTDELRQSSILEG
eukprot:4120011-Amphidinium_carterae.1